MSRRQPRTTRQKVLLGVRLLFALSGIAMAVSAATSESDKHLLSDGTHRKPSHDDEQQAGAQQADEAPEEAEPEQAEKVAATASGDGAADATADSSDDGAGDGPAG